MPDLFPSDPSASPAPFGQTKEISREIVEIPVFIRIAALPAQSDQEGSGRFKSEDICIVYIMEGALTMTIDGAPVPLQRDDLLLHMSSHSCSCHSDSGCRYCLIVAGTILFQNSIALQTSIIDRIASGSPPYYLLAAGSAGSEDALNLVHLMIGLQNQALIPYRLRMVGYLHLLLAAILSSQEDNSSFPKEPYLPESRNLNRMLRYIHNHYQARIQLDDIAEAGNISRSRCSPVFRKYLHMTPIEYVNNYRLDVSRSYLRDKSLSIASIASACGFSGQSYYTKLFVRRYGCTPSEYRQGFPDRNADNR